MCSPTFQDFIKQYPTYRKFSNSAMAESIFNHLRQLDTIDSMIAVNNAGKPALYGAQEHIEKNYANMQGFDLNESFVKQCVGSMVRCILTPFGYVPKLQRDLPRDESNFFKSAMHYELVDSKVQYRLVKELRLEKVDHRL